MNRTESAKVGPKALLGLLIAGIGIGVLIGLSVSPAVGGVITAVIGVAAAIVTGLGSIEGKTDSSITAAKVNPWPLATLVVGLVAGSFIGIIARNNHWLGSDASGEVTKWVALGIPAAAARDALFDAQYPRVSATRALTETQERIVFWTGLGISQTEAIRAAFEHDIGSTKVEAAAPAQVTPDTRVGTYLFAVNITECESLTAAAQRYAANSNADELRAALLSSTSAGVRRLVQITPDPKIIKEIIEQVICVEQ